MSRYPNIVGNESEEEMREDAYQQEDAERQAEAEEISNKEESERI